MAGPLSEVQLSSLPRCFRILVVCGPTGSGKSRIIGQLLQHFKLQEKQGDIIFQDNEAVCGHADLGDDFLEKLQAVGFWAEKNCDPLGRVVFQFIYCLVRLCWSFFLEKIFDLTVRGLSASSLSASIQDDGRLLLINKVITTRNDVIDGLIHVFFSVFSPL